MMSLLDRRREWGDVLLFVFRISLRAVTDPAGRHINKRLNADPGGNVMHGSVCMLLPAFLNDAFRVRHRSSNEL